MNFIRKQFYNLFSILNNLTSTHYKFERFFYEFFHFKFEYVFRRRNLYKFKIDNNYIKFRVFFPKKKSNNVIFYIHGGGFVIGSSNSYAKTCQNLSYISNSYVISIDYRRAPEYKFPYALNDCNNVIDKIISLKEVKNKNIIIMGDSAGANLTIGVTYLLKKKYKNLFVKNILLYPAINNNYSINNNFNSIKKYSKGYVLTLKKVVYYFNSYIPSCEKSDNILISPILHKNYKFMDDVLILAADYDLLKDEGKYLYDRLKKDGVSVNYKVITNTIHGFYNDIFNSKSIKISNNIIKSFIEER